MDAQSNVRYPMPVSEYYYRNTSHRQYLSKWLESVIVAVLKSHGADPHKAPDRGRRVDKTQVVSDVVGFQKQIGSVIWAKDSRVKVGRADITCFFNGVNGIGMYNLEVKVGKDRPSKLQLAEKLRAESNGEFWFWVKTLDDFLYICNVKHFEKRHN